MNQQASSVSLGSAATSSGLLQHLRRQMHQACGQQLLPDHIKQQQQQISQTIRQLGSTRI
jgi:hypothetical protein